MKKVISLVEKVRRDDDLYSRESSDIPWRRAFQDEVSPALSPLLFKNYIYFVN